MAEVTIRSSFIFNEEIKRTKMAKRIKMMPIVESECLQLDCREGITPLSCDGSEDDYSLPSIGDLASGIRKMLSGQECSPADTILQACWERELLFIISFLSYVGFWVKCNTFGSQC